MTTTELPDSAEVDASIKLITDNAQRIFLWDYERSREQLVTLYNKAMSSQWSSVRDLDWSTEVDPEALVASSPQQNLMVAIAGERLIFRDHRSRSGARRNTSNSASSPSKPHSVSSCTVSKGP